MASTRLPGKVLAPVARDPMLALLVRRLRVSDQVSTWWLATTRRPEDDLLEEWGRALGLLVYRGDTDNVLRRFVNVLDRAEADWVVRITADNPFTHGATIDAGLASIASCGGDVDIVADHPDRQYPLGFCPQIISADVLRRAEAVLDPENFHRVHAGASWIIEKRRPASWPSPSEPRPSWRWTVDTPADLQMAQHVFGALGPTGALAPYGRIVEMLDANPEWVEINLGVTQREAEDR